MLRCWPFFSHWMLLFYTSYVPYVPSYYLYRPIIQQAPIKHLTQPEQTGVLKPADPVSLGLEAGKTSPFGKEYTVTKCIIVFFVLRYTECETSRSFVYTRNIYIAFAGLCWENKSRRIKRMIKCVKRCPKTTTTSLERIVYRRRSCARNELKMSKTFLKT